MRRGQPPRARAAAGDHLARKCLMAEPVGWAHRVGWVVHAKPNAADLSGFTCVQPNLWKLSNTCLAVPRGPAKNAGPAAQQH
jgi:hypothetical protein